MKVRLFWFLIILEAFTGCAKKGTPSGGPIDDVSPRIVSAYPDSFATSVPRDTTLHITFSEKIDPEILDRAIWMFPSTLVIKKISRTDFTLKVAFRDLLPESTTVSILVGTSLMDRRGNQLMNPRHWVFSTGSEVQAGSIRGFVKSNRSGRGRKSERILVGVFAAQDTLPDFTEAPLLAITEVQASGKFALFGLPDTLGRVHVVPYKDLNGNNVTDARDEFISAKFETIYLSPDSTQHDLALRLVNPEAPGIVMGYIARAEQDSTVMGVELYPSEDDSLGAAAASGQLQPQGAYVVAGVPPGSYHLVAFCDANENRFRDVLEPWMVWTDTLLVFPGDTTRVDTIQAINCAVEK